MTTYHWQDVKSTTPFPYLPYRQKFDTPVMLSVGACFGMLTGVRYDRKDPLMASSYYIRGIFVRRPLKVKGTYSVTARYHGLAKLSEEDLTTFYKWFSQSKYYATYCDVRAKSLS